MASNVESLKKHEIPGRIAVIAGNGGLAKLVVTSSSSTAEVYPHGAHVTAFQKNGEPPLIFMSRKSEFADTKAIRGGVPICYPWFGPREGSVVHGFARITEWDLAKTAANPDGSVRLVFTLPDSVAVKANWPVTKVNFIVTVGDKLTMELAVSNLSNDNFTYEDCLHTYFAVADINQVAITGLEKTPFDDFAAGAAGARHDAENAALRITKETNRIYFHAPQPVEIRDEKLKRIIRIEKTNSKSTVVWNPWTTQKLPGDWDPADYQQMVCVEAGNVKQNKATLGANQTSELRVAISSRPL